MGIRVYGMWSGYDVGGMLSHHLNTHSIHTIQYKVVVYMTTIYYYNNQVQSPTGQPTNKAMHDQYSVCVRVGT